MWMDICFDCVLVLCFVMSYVLQSGEIAHTRVHYHYYYLLWHIRFPLWKMCVLKKCVHTTCHQGSSSAARHTKYWLQTCHSHPFLLLQNCSSISLNTQMGSRDISVVMAPDSWWKGQVKIPAGAAAGEFSSPGSTFCADSYFGIHYTPVLLQQHVKDPGHSAKSAGGRLQLNTHTPLVCGFTWSDTVHGCMVYTERAEMAADSCGTSHASAVSTPLRWIFKTRYKKLFTHVESHGSAVSLRRTALYKSDQ